MRGEIDVRLGEVKSNWKWVLGLGVLFIILGLIGLGSAFALTVATATLFGILLLIGGAAQLGDVFKCRGWKGILWHILIAFLYLMAGITVLKNPAMASIFFTAILGVILMAVGLSRIIMAIANQGIQGWVWILTGGVVTLLLGGVILAHWPISGLWAIGLFVAIDLIMHGWSYVVIALTARKMARAT